MFFFSARAKKIDCVHVHWRVCRSSQEAFHIRSMADISRVCFPRGCDPGSKSNARIDLRQLSDSLWSTSLLKLLSGKKEQKGHVHYSWISWPVVSHWNMSIIYNSWGRKYNIFIANTLNIPDIFKNLYTFSSTETDHSVNQIEWSSLSWKE